MQKQWTIILLIFVVCSCALKTKEKSMQNSEQSYSGVLNGKVINESGIPIPEVTVSIVSSPEPVPDIAAITNSNGEFSFSYLKNGSYKLRFILNDLNIVKTVKFEAVHDTIIVKIPD